MKNPYLIDSFQLKSGERIYLSDLEKHGLSYVPCDHNSPAVDRYAHLWNTQEQVTLASYGETETDHYIFKQMQGVQIMTGQPTFLPSKTSPSGYLYLIDFDIENLLKTTYPDHYKRLITTIYTLHRDRTPCHIRTKSDGDRFSLYVPGFSNKIEYHDKTSGKMLFEFFSKNGLSRLDNRYGLINGSLFDIPEFHTPEDTNSLTDAVCEILEEIGSRHQNKSTRNAEIAETSQIGELNINWVATTIKKDDGTTYEALVSQLFPTKNCQKTKHASNRNEVSFTKFKDGSTLGHCFNCGGSWWEVKTNSRKTNPTEHKTHTHIPYQPTQKDIDALIANAPPVEVRESPSFRHFSTEERAVVRQVLKTSPDAGWHGSTPIWTPKYEHLYPLTNKFSINGQPSEIEKRRVWSTQFGTCKQCGGITAKWIDRYLLTAGYYCDGCHKDYPLGSYLKLELNRKLPNSIISEYQGFLGKNPDFVDFRLFSPGMLTHLGAGMGTGKTTEIVKVLIALALQGLGKGIIAVPRIALAQQLAYQLRWQHGHKAWGLYTEGSSKENKFIGTHGAIVCLPSLPQAVADAKDIGIEELYIAIDELDFGYELLALTTKQSTEIKKILRDTLNSTGLVVAGQTESTLALEAFAQEIKAKEVQGFYNTAESAEGHVVLKQHSADTNINAFLASGIDDIAEQLRNEQNVYAFCGSRRNSEILAKEFNTENPLLYNAYTKGEYRSHELLRYQRLTDSRLFIGTSAAGVGISFLDKKAITIIMNELIFGSRHANMAVQKAIRDRGRRGVLIHYKPYNFSLPVRPTEQRDVSLYHEALKQKLDISANIDVPTHAITKIAAAQALASLANIQFETYVRYNLGTVGNMDVIDETPHSVPKDVAEAIGHERAEIRRIENELKKEKAKAILKTILDKDTDTELLSSSEIRRQRNRGQLHTDAALAHELANEAARAVGWDDEINQFQEDDPFKDLFTDTDIEVALALVERNFDFEALIKKRDGYLAVNAPNWTTNRFELEVSSADTQLVIEGLGIELTAVKDPRFLGELLQTLLNALIGQILETQSLIEKVKAVLATTASTGKTYGQELLSGALGPSEYRKARFLHCPEDENTIVEWVARFISEYYPARLAKRENFYGLQPDTHIDLYLKSFERWLHHQPDIFDTAHIQLDIFEPIEMPESNAELKQTARQRRKKGEKLKDIAGDLDVSLKSVSLWCESITPKRQHKETRKERQQKRNSSKQTNNEKKQNVLRLYSNGMSKIDIHKKTKISRTTIDKYIDNEKF